MVGLRWCTTDVKALWIPLTAMTGNTLVKARKTCEIMNLKTVQIFIEHAMMLH